MYRQPVITTPPVTTLLTIHVFAMMASLGMAPLVKAYVSHRLVLVFLDVFHSFTHLFKVFFIGRILIAFKWKFTAHNQNPCENCHHHAFCDQTTNHTCVCNHGFVGNGSNCEGRLYLRNRFLWILTACSLFCFWFCLFFLFLLFVL